MEKIGPNQIRQPRHVTVLYRIVMNIINVTLIVLLIRDNVFPKASLPNATFTLLLALG